MKLRLIDADHERSARLREAFQDLTFVDVQEVDKAVYLHPPQGLDMIFMTLPAAERWKPDFRLREAQILKTSPEDQLRGFPPLIVTGVNLTPQDPTDPVSQVRIVLESTLAAVKLYNAQRSDQVEYLGYWVMDLTRGLTTAQLIDLLHQVL